MLPKYSLVVDDTAQGLEQAEGAVKDPGSTMVETVKVVGHRWFVVPAGVGMNRIDAECAAIFGIVESYMEGLDSPPSTY